MLFLVWLLVQFNLAVICQGDDTPYLGHPVQLGDFKHVVFVVSLPYKKCGGSIISENHVITAGHCVDCTPKQHIVVVAGQIDTQDANGVFRKVQDVHIHPGYNRGIKNPSCARKCYMWLSQWYNGPMRLQQHSVNDVAVLRLMEPMPLGATVGKVALPQPSSSSFDDSCALCFMTMWQKVEDDEGPSFKLYWARFRILSDEECKKFDWVFRNTEFCAMDITERAALLRGHSGGGLVCNGVLVGIATMSKMMGSRPALFQKVASFRPFIDEKMALAGNSLLDFRSDSDKFGIIPPARSASEIIH